YKGRSHRLLEFPVNAAPRAIEQYSIDRDAGTSARGRQPGDLIIEANAQGATIAVLLPRSHDVDFDADNTESTGCQSPTRERAALIVGTQLSAAYRTT